MSGYTKGPWVVSRFLSGDSWPERRWSVSVDNNFGTCVCVSPKYADLDDMSDAHLIAAAPEMYEALRRQTDNMAFMLNHLRLPDQWFEKFNLELEEDRAALAKAEGKS